MDIHHHDRVEIETGEMSGLRDACVAGPRQRLSIRLT
jgi:hypothetical protein